MQTRDFPCTGHGLSVISLSYAARISVTMFNVNNALIRSYIGYEVICNFNKIFGEKKKNRRCVSTVRRIKCVSILSLMAVLNFG